MVNPIKTSKNKCVDCDKIIAPAATRCKPCNGLFFSGEKSNSWKGGVWKFGKECPNCDGYINSHDKNTTQCHSCHIKQNKGKNHHNYNKDLTDKEREGRKNLMEFRDWALEVKIKNNFTCDICDKYSSGKLNSHHLFNWADYPELRFDVDNGVCLCESCHILYHKLCGRRNNTLEEYENYKKNFDGGRK